MTFILLESFDQYNTSITASDGSGIQQGGWSCGFPSDSSIITGRYGGQALRKPASGGREDWYRQFTPGLSTFCTGFDFRTNALNTAILTFTEYGYVDHLWLEVTAAGALQIRRGNAGGTVLGTSATGVIAVNTWCFIEVEAVLADSGGQVAVALDGITVINVSSVDTRNGGPVGVWDAFTIIESGQHDFDNIYIKSSLGLLGPIKALPMNASSDDANTGFTQLSGSTLYEMVDEVKTDLDTTYISASAVNDQATFGMTDISGTGVGTVHAVKVQINAKKTDGVAGRAVKTVIKDGSNTVAGASDIILPAGYGFSSNIFETDPSSAAWTVSTVNGFFAGVKVTV